MGRRRNNWHRRHTRRHMRQKPHRFPRKKKINYDSFIQIILIVGIILLVVYWDDIKAEFREVKDLEHYNPITVSYPVDFNGVDKIELTLHGSVYHYFRFTAPHEYSAYYIPTDWEIDYWKMYAGSKHDNYVTEEIINQVVITTSSEGDRAARTLIRFVQQIPYDWERYSSNDWNMRYPYETLYDGKGVCAEKSILLAKLLNELGYGVALFNYVSEEHMAVGIQCPYDKSNYQSGYCFIEATDVYPIGQIPMEYVGGVDIRDAMPQIIIISEGKVFDL